jgi:hypothetical protein
MLSAKTNSSNLEFAFVGDNAWERDEMFDSRHGGVFGCFDRNQGWIVETQGIGVMVDSP